MGNNEKKTESDTGGDEVSGIANPNWIIEVVKVIVPGILIAALTSYITVRLAIKRFREEKLWEKKAEMYYRLLESLHFWKEFNREHVKDIENFFTNPASMGMSKTKKAELNEDQKKYNREFKKLRDLASLYLCKEAVSVLEEFDDKEKESEELFHVDVLESFKTELDATIVCLDKLKEVAKKDL